MAYETGRRAVEIAHEDLRPSKVLTREAFLNAITAITAIGGSTNAQPHVVAMARHAGVRVTPEDWGSGYDVPLLVDMQPAGSYLGERFHRAGGVPAVLSELLGAGKLYGGAFTVTGRTLAENVEGRGGTDREELRKAGRRAADLWQSYLAEFPGRPNVPEDRTKHARTLLGRAEELAGS